MIICHVQEERNVRSTNIYNDFSNTERFKRGQVYRPKVSINMLFHSFHRKLHRREKSDVTMQWDRYFANFTVTKQNYNCLVRQNSSDIFITCTVVFIESFTVQKQWAQISPSPDVFFFYQGIQKSARCHSPQIYYCNCVFSCLTALPLYWSNRIGCGHF